MSITSNIIRGGMAALGLCSMAGSALAGSEIFPGLTTGIITGYDIPVGLYNITGLNYGVRSQFGPGTLPGNSGQDVGEAVPLYLIFQSPWQILGAQVQFQAATAQAFLGEHSPAFDLYRSGYYDTLLMVGLNWNLGDGFGFKIMEGANLPATGQIARADYTAFQQNVAFAYVGHEWELNADAIFGTGQSASPANVFPLSTVLGNTRATGGPAWFNLDLTAFHVFDKWQLGGIGYYSSDLSSPYTGYARQSQFALGGIVGYNFGPVTIQLKLSRDVYEQNYGGYDTRGWMNIIFPIWNPAPSAAPVIAKY